MDSIEWILKGELTKMPYKFSKLGEHSLEEYIQVETILESSLGLIKTNVESLPERIELYEGTIENKKEYVLKLMNIYINKSNRQ